MPASNVNELRSDPSLCFMLCWNNTGRNSLRASPGNNKGTTVAKASGGLEEIKIISVSNNCAAWGPSKAILAGAEQAPPALVIRRSFKAFSDQRIKPLVTVFACLSASGPKIAFVISQEVTLRKV